MFRLRFLTKVENSCRIYFYHENNMILLFVVNNLDMTVSTPRARESCYT